MDKIQEIDELSRDKRVVVMVGASWCGPCKIKKPTFNILKEQILNVEMQFIDVDDHPEFKQHHAIGKLPTFIAFQNGDEVNRMEGAKQTMEELKNFILG